MDASAQFATMFFIPFFMKKFGKHMTYMVGLVSMGLGFLGTGFAGTNVALLIIFNALKGIGLGDGSGEISLKAWNNFTSLSDICRYNIRPEYKTVQRYQ